MKAAVERLAKLVIYWGNSSSIAVAQKEGVGKVKRLSGRLLWLQQRQGNELTQRRILSFPGRRARMLLYLMSFEDEDGSLGREEFMLRRRSKKQGRG